MKNLFKISAFLFIMALHSAVAQTTLVVNKTTTVSSGFYNVEIYGDAMLFIDGPVSIANINPNNKNAQAFITVNQKGVLTLTSSLNMNGALSIINYGTINSKSVEMQNANSKDNQNIFNNYGKHNINGDLQISSDWSTYFNYGEVVVTNYTNFHRGHFIAGNCGYLETVGLNVNKDNVLSGSGFVRVVNNINLNANLTDSPDIKFCFRETSKTPVYYKNNYGAATLTCERNCTPAPLALKITDVSARKAETNNSIRIAFKVTENTNLKQVKVRYSIDAKTFREVMIISPEVLKVGSTYSATFDIKK